MDYNNAKSFTPPCIYNLCIKRWSPFLHTLTALGQQEGVGVRHSPFSVSAETSGSLERFERFCPPAELSTFLREQVHADPPQCEATWQSQLMPASRGVRPCERQLVYASLPQSETMWKSQVILTNSETGKPHRWKIETTNRIKPYRQWYFFLLVYAVRYILSYAEQHISTLIKGFYFYQ